MTHPYREHTHGLWLAAAALLAFAAADAAASGTRAGIKAEPGEIVLIRDVPARVAYRLGPPATALIADPRPNREIGGALGVGELSDADYAAMGAGGTGVRPGQTTVERTLGSALEQSLKAPAGNGRASASANGVEGMLSAPMGALSRTTGSIDGQVRGALAQFPPAGGR